MRSPGLGVKILLLLMVIGTTAGVSSYLTYRWTHVEWEAILPPRPEGEVVQVPKTLRPQIITVEAERAGVSSEIMESEVTRPIEQAMVGLEGVKGTRSRTTEGASKIVVELDPDCNLDFAMLHIQNAAAIVRPQLPFDVDPVIISKTNSYQLPILWLALHGSEPLDKLSEIADYRVRTKLLAIPGVREVQFAGLRSRSTKIWLDPVRLRALELVAEDILDALRNQNVEAGGRFFHNPESLLRVTRKPLTLEELGNIVVSLRAGQPIRLRDVATIENTMDHGDGSLGRFQGKPAVGLAVYATDWVDAAELVATIKKELARLRELLPKDVHLDVAVDFSPRREQKPAPRDLLLDVRFPSGSSLEQVDEGMRHLEKIVTALKAPGTGKPVAASLWTTIGKESGSLLLEGTIYRRLEAEENLEETCKALRQQLGQFPGVRVALLELSGQPFPPQRRYPIEVILVGPDLDMLARWSRRVEEQLAKSDAVTDVLSDYQSPVPQTMVHIDREKAAQHGITARQVANAVQSVVGRGTSQRLFEGSQRYEVRIRSAQDPRKAPDQLKDLLMRAPNDKLVSVAELAKLEVVPGSPLVSHYRGQRCVSITANPSASLSVEKASTTCREIAEQIHKEMNLSAGYEVVDPTRPWGASPPR